MKMIVPKAKGENKGHYTPGVISNGILYISGQLSIDPDTREIPKGGITQHAAQCFANLDRVLVEAGAKREDVIQCRIYLDQIENWDAVNELYGEYFGAHKPARIVIPTGPLHFGCLMELEAIAEIKEEC